MSNVDNPLIAGLKLPGRTFQLPSRGVFYKNGELAGDVRDGEVHVHPLSALEEINLKNPDQLFNGEAINKVFPRAIPAIQKPAQLLTRDVDALMVFLRAVTYGSRYDFEARHHCEGAKDNSYTLDLEEVIVGMKMISADEIDHTYSLNLDGQIIKLKPNRYQQIIDLLTSNQAKKDLSPEDQKKNVITMALGIIESVDGISDQKLIEEWLRVLPGPRMNRIAEKSDELNNWGPSLTKTCVCKDCGQPFDVDVPINVVSFFSE